MTGNQAIAVGSLRGGVRFVGCYPITPATDLVEWLAPQIQKLGGRLVMAEDELSSINMVLGASYGGVPAMTVTSGPGLSLMVETIGLAIAAEVPAVIIDVMRGGPSTGIPSKTEQSDINIAVYGCHGDAPHVVLAPTSVRDCMFTGEWAVYLAESLQTPVIVLSDQALGLAYAVIDPKLDRPQPLARRTDLSVGPFKRYAVGTDPVTAMPRPGTAGGQWVGEGLTHNETGIPVGGASVHLAQIDKRARKIAQFDAWAALGQRLGRRRHRHPDVRLEHRPGAGGSAQARRGRTAQPRHRLARALAIADRGAGPCTRRRPPHRGDGAEPQRPALPPPAGAQGHSTEC